MKSEQLRITTGPGAMGAAHTRCISENKLWTYLSSELLVFPRWPSYQSIVPIVPDQNQLDPVLLCSLSLHIRLDQSNCQHSFQPEILTSIILDQLSTDIKSTNSKSGWHGPGLLKLIFLCGLENCLVKGSAKPKGKTIAPRHSANASHCKVFCAALAE